MQNDYIDNAIISKAGFKVITVNGYQLSGQIIRDGGDHIVMISGADKLLIFKSAISTIKPM